MNWKRFFLPAAVSGIVACVLCFCMLTSEDGEDYEIHYEPYFITYTENGESYTMEAVPGQVMLWLQSDDISRYLTDKCRIVCQIPSVGYYLLDVGKGNEGQYITDFYCRKTSDVAFPNILLSPEELNVYLLDKFNYDWGYAGARHGEKVRDALLQSGVHPDYINDIDVTPNAFSHSVSLGLAFQEVFTILDLSSPGDKIIINMSFGPEWPDPLLWDDPSVTERQRREYIKEYSRTIIWFAGLVSSFSDRDVVIVKSAGNEGIVDFQGVILESVEKEIDLFLNGALAEKLKKALYESFIFVSAEDDNYNVKYGNGASDSRYHPLITKVDVSDWKYRGQKHIAGTSFAAPMVAAMIAKYAYEENVRAKDALNTIKLATENAPDQVLDEVVLQDYYERPPILQIKRDIEGQDLNGLMTICYDDIVDFHVVEEEINEDEYQALVYVHLTRYGIDIEVNATLVYEMDDGSWLLESIEFWGGDIKGNPDYSAYIEESMSYDFFPCFYLKNTSDMRLWVGVEYRLNSDDMKVSVVSIEAHDKAMLTSMGRPKECRIMFAYRADEGAMRSEIRDAARGEHKLITNARVVCRALLEGDMYTLKKYIAPYYYESLFPEGDEMAKIRLGALSSEERHALNSYAKYASGSIFRNRGGDVMNVSLHDEVTGNILYVQYFVDEDDPEEGCQIIDIFSI